MDVVSKNNINVFLTGLGDVVQMSITQILPIRPKAGQKAKILNGELKGYEVQLHNIPNATSAIVRLMATNRYIAVPLNFLASMPQDGASFISLTGQ